MTRVTINVLALAAACFSVAACGGGTNKKDIIVIDGGDEAIAVEEVASGPDPLSIADWFLAQPGNAEIALRPGGQGRTDVSFATLADGGYVGALDPTAADWRDGWTIGSDGDGWRPASEGTLGGDLPVGDGTCPEGTELMAVTSLRGALEGEMDVCRLASRYDRDGQTVTLTNDNVYRLGRAGGQGTIIGDGDRAGAQAGLAAEVRLVIEPGTLVLGGASEVLAITRNSSIQVEGTAANPVVMASQAWFDAWNAGEEPTSHAGEWGGLVISGYASTAACSDGVTCDARAGGFFEPFHYGGGDDDDGSGQIRYLVVRDSGLDVDGEGDTLGGVNLYGVGRATEIDHVQVYDGLEDGVAIYGGAVDVDHVVVTGAGDDGLDWQDGYHGSAAFVFVDQRGARADRGMEGDGVSTEDAAGPAPTFLNLTLIGSPSGSAHPRVGMLLRRGARAHVARSHVIGADYCLDIDDDATFESVADGSLSIIETLVSCDQSFLEE